MGAVYINGSLSRSLEIAGNSFIALGALLDAVGSTFILNTKKEIDENFLLVGSWVQVIGALILTYAFTYLGQESINRQSIFIIVNATVLLEIAILVFQLLFICPVIIHLFFHLERIIFKGIISWDIEIGIIGK